MSTVVDSENTEVSTMWSLLWHMREKHRKCNIVVNALVEVHTCGNIAWKSCMNNIDKEPLGYPRRTNISCILLFMGEKSQNLIKATEHLPNYDIYFSLKSISPRK